MWRDSAAWSGLLLDVEPSMDEAYCVGFSVGGQDVGLDPHGHSLGMTGPAGYRHVDDIKERLQGLRFRASTGHGRSRPSGTPPLALASAGVGT